MRELLFTIKWRDFCKGVIWGVTVLPLMLFWSGVPSLSADFVRIIKPILQARANVDDACFVDGADAENISFTPKRIVISGANIDLQIVSVPLENGTWEVHEGVANYAMETDLVSGKKGNVGIYAHDKDNGFGEIKKLPLGMRIEVYGDEYLGTYEMVAGLTMTPENVDVFYPTENPMLTLATCDGTFSEKRYILQAKLVNVKKLNCNE